MQTPSALSRALSLTLAVGAFVAFTGCAADPNLLNASIGGDGTGAPAGITADGPLSQAQLGRLRKCESGGNYRAVSSSGSFRGAYQFNRSTWNGVASRHYPDYVGVSPEKAPPVVQDAMAQKLWGERGRQPWPVCGRRV